MGLAERKGPEGGVRVGGLSATRRETERQAGTRLYGVFAENAKKGAFESYR